MNTSELKVDKNLTIDGRTLSIGDDAQYKGIWDEPNQHWHPHFLLYRFMKEVHMEKGKVEDIKMGHNPKAKLVFTEKIMPYGRPAVHWISIDQLEKLN